MENNLNAINITPEDSVVPVYLLPLTEEEILDREAFAAQIAADMTAELQKAAAKESALIKLAALGLTEEEARAIVGV